MTSRQYRLKDHSMMLASGFVFAVMAQFAFAAREFLDWSVVLSARLAVGWLVAVGIVFVMGQAEFVLSRSFFTNRFLWIRSTASTIAVFSLFYALPRLPAGDVMALASTYPVWLVLLFKKRRKSTTPIEWAFIALTIVGILLVGKPTFDFVSMAAVAAILHAISTAVSIHAHVGLKDVPPHVVVLHYTSVAFLISTAYLVMTDSALPFLNELEVASGHIWLLLIGVGVCGTLGQFTRATALSNAVTVTLALAALSQIPFSILMDVIVWSAMPTATSFVGSLFILIPTALLAAHAFGRK